ncbi:hypothetical protein V5O48_014130 [Marasmius crinis-equi]|uniref:Uncharacterized protein n=1 Tax=Marasmius crinis-equi TaxID=585013 RepID=A0ABR3EY61_9AGAR
MTRRFHHLTNEPLILHCRLELQGCQTSALCLGRPTTAIRLRDVREEADTWGQGRWCDVRMEKTRGVQEKGNRGGSDGRNRHLRSERDHHKRKSSLQQRTLPHAPLERNIVFEGRYPAHADFSPAMKACMATGGNTTLNPTASDRSLHR